MVLMLKKPECCPTRLLKQYDGMSIRLDTLLALDRRMDRWTDLT